MITSGAWRGKRYAVLGLARSGRATINALLASGAVVTAWDTNADTREDAVDDAMAMSMRIDGDVELHLADPMTLDLTGFAGVVVSPGVPLNRHPITAHAAKHGVAVIGDIELFAQARSELPPHKVVGVTGTNGKSTTTALVHHILQTAGVPTTMGGNIGLPILGQDPLPEGGVYVLELSSYQIDLTFSLDCDVAVLLNVTPDHLDRYESFEAYAASKARLFEMQSEQSFAVIAIDDDCTRSIASQITHNVVQVATTQGWHWDGVRFAKTTFRKTPMLFVEGDRFSPQADWPALQGPHNAQNAAAAVATSYALNVAPWVYAKGLETYPGLPHRMERVRDRDGVLYVNDSKATNADSTAPALAAYPAIRWILGGQAKTADLDACSPHFGHVRSAYTIGEAGSMFADLLRPHMAVEEAGTLDVAVAHAARDATAGDTVLLSPACASFDQFQNFEDRGDRFRQLVGAL